MKLLNALYSFYFSDIIDGFLRKFNQEEEFSLANTKISDQYLQIKVARLTKEEDVQVPWERVGTRDYHTYFAIYDTSNAAKINRTYSYLSDWNTAVVCAVVRSVAHYRQQAASEIAVD